VVALPDDLRVRLDNLFRSDPAAAQLGVELDSWSPGHAVINAVLTDSHTNFMGVGHGGVLLTLGDIAMSYASNGYGRVAVAIQIDVAYHRAVGSGDEVVATATEISRTRRFANHRLELHVGDLLVCSATGITYRTDEWHFGPDAWTETWRVEH